VSEKVVCTINGVKKVCDKNGLVKDCAWENFVWKMVRENGVENNRWRMLYRRKVAASLTGDFLYWACHTITSCTPAWNHAHSSSARKDASRPGCSVLWLQNRYGPLTGDCVLAAPPVGTTRAANNQGSFYRGRFPGDFLVVSKSNVRQ
jgi:hypothetical protein